jgi:hypothetical protein
MPSRQQRLNEAELRRLSRLKAYTPATAPALGPELVSFFKNAVQKRQTKLAKIAECWNQIIPPTLSEHCSLESLNRGTLTVLVDSSPHLYQLKEVLLAGLEKQLQHNCKSAGLRKVSLKPGRWYEGNEGREKLHF